MPSSFALESYCRVPAQRPSVCLLARFRLRVQHCLILPSSKVPCATAGSLNSNPRRTSHVADDAPSASNSRLLGAFLFCCLETTPPPIPVSRQILRPGANIPQFCPVTKAQTRSSSAAQHPGNAGGGRRQLRLSRSWPRRHRPCSRARLSQERPPSRDAAGRPACLLTRANGSPPSALHEPHVESACQGSSTWRSRQRRLYLTPGGRGLQYF